MTTKTGEATVNTVHDLLKSFARSVVKVHFPETDSHGNPNLVRFFFDNGRLPYATDHIKPWLYRGWLMPYLQRLEDHLPIAKRYDYVSRTLDKGSLLDEPLPYIEFDSEFDASIKPGLKMLDGAVAYVERSSGTWNGTRDFCEWLGFALGVTNEPSKLKADVQEYLYRNFNLEPLLLNPTDYLGQMLCETNHGKRNGFYPTPINVVKLMAGMINGNGIADHRREKICDPCVGTGRMLLLSSNYSMRLYGQDIDPLCCLITKINLALYAPWYHIPESFFGDGDEENDEQEDEPSEENEFTPVVQTAAPETAKTPERTEKPEIEANTAQKTTIQSVPATPLDELRKRKQRLDKNKSKNNSKFTTEVTQPFLWDFGKTGD